MLKNEKTSWKRCQNYLWKKKRCSRSSIKFLKNRKKYKRIHRRKSNILFLFRFEIIRHLSIPLDLTNSTKYRFLSQFSTEYLFKIRFDDHYSHVKHKNCMYIDNRYIRDGSSNSGKISNWYVWLSISFYGSADKRYV